MEHKRRIRARSKVVKLVIKTKGRCKKLKKQSSGTNSCCVLVGVWVPKKIVSDGASFWSGVADTPVTVPFSHQVLFARPDHLFLSFRVLAV